jgi:hypothetical protein
MTSPELENLARICKLKREVPSDDEIQGLLRSADERLPDAAREDLSYARRFDLAYNAAHALALAALRRAGYRSDNRVSRLRGAQRRNGRCSASGSPTHAPPIVSPAFSKPPMTCLC